MATTWKTADLTTLLNYYPTLGPTGVKPMLIDDRTVGAIKSKYYALIRGIGEDVAVITVVTLQFEPQPDKTVKIGESVDIQCGTVIEYGYKPVIWTASNSKVNITNVKNTHTQPVGQEYPVINGTSVCTLGATAVGKTIITATCDDISKSATITVVA